MKSYPSEQAVVNTVHTMLVLGLVARIVFCVAHLVFAIPKDTYDGPKTLEDLTTLLADLGYNGVVSVIEPAQLVGRDHSQFSKCSAAVSTHTLSRDARLHYNCVKIDVSFSARC